MGAPSPQVEVRQATAAEVLPFVLQAGRGASHALCREIVAAGVPFVVTEDGAPIFGYVLEACGRDMVITAAGGRSKSFDLTRAGLALAELQAQGFAAVRFQTRRYGLVRKATRLGYSVIDTQQDNGSVYIMRKAIG